jgi:centrosomal protein CEP41
MVEKGYENCYLLSGGIEKFLEEFTDLVEGTDVPVPVKKVQEEKLQKKAAAKKSCQLKRHEACKHEK